MEKLETIGCPICSSDNYHEYCVSFDVKIGKSFFEIVRCDNCEFVYTNPRPSYENINRYYGEHYYAYQKTNNHKLISTSNPKGNLLDVGCGSGEFLIEKKSQGYNVYGIEIDSTAIKRASQLGLQVLFFDGFFGHFPDEYFDIVTFNNSLEHIHKLKDIIVEIHRVIKPAGKLIIKVPNIESYDSRIWREFWRHLDVPRHLYHFSSKSVRNLLTKSNFKVENITSYNMAVFSKKLPYLKSIYTTFRMIAYTNHNKGMFRNLKIPIDVFISVLKYIVHIHLYKNSHNGQFLLVTAKKRSVLCK